MAAISRIMAYGALITGLIGCAKPFPFEGRWQGTMDVPVSPGTDPSIAVTLNRVVLVLEANQRFTLLQSGITRTGTWRAQGDRATLTPTAVMNRAISNQPQEVALRAGGGDTISLDDPNDLSDKPVILKRVVQP